MDLRFGHIELFVKDPVVSKDFYTNVLGFKLVEEQGDGNFVWLSSGESLILLRPGDGSEKGSEYGMASAGIVIYTGDISEARINLESKGLEFKGTDGSDNCLTFTDPDGNWFQLVDPDNH